MKIGIFPPAQNQDYGDSVLPAKQDDTGGGGGTITVQDEGVTQSSTVTTLNFVGANVAASGAGATETVTVSGVQSVASADGSISVTNPTTTVDLSVDPYFTFYAARHRHYAWTAASITPLVFGAAIPTSVGAPGNTLHNPSNAGYFSQFSYPGMTSAATAGTAVGNISVLQFWRGNSTYLGGFKAIFNFGLQQNCNRVVAGFVPSVTVTGTSEPSNQLNCVFLGCDSTDTNMQIMNNDGVGTCTKTDTGIAVATSVVYSVIFTCLSNSSTIDYAVTATTNANVRSTFSGTLSTDLPTSTQLMAWTMWGAPSTNVACIFAPMWVWVGTPGY